MKRPMHKSTVIGRLIKLVEASQVYSLLRNKNISESSGFPCAFFFGIKIKTYTLPFKMDTFKPPLTTQHAKTYWSLTRIAEPLGVSPEKRSGHIYFMEDNLLHGISKL